MKRVINVSAPGKVILFGEHSVVYGKEALACAIDLRSSCRVCIEDYNEHYALKIESPDVGLHCSISKDVISQLVQDVTLEEGKPVMSVDGLAKAKDFAPKEDDRLKQLAFIIFLSLYAFVAKGSDSEKSVAVSLSSELPIGAGLGSSASYATCIAVAFLMAYNKLSVTSSTGLLTDDDKDLINHYVFQSEKIVHGQPSGIDNTICIYGGALSFKAAQISSGLRLPPLTTLVVNTKVSRSTKDIVAGVKERYVKHPKIYDMIFETIQELAVKGKELLLKMAKENLPSGEIELCYSYLQDYFKLNDDLLRSIGVSHPALEQISKLCRDFGLVSKLTGAGGGGCSIALIPPGYTESKLDELKKAMINCGFDCWVSKIGCRGVTVETTSSLKGVVRDITT